METDSGTRMKILMADDDEEDRMLAEDALREARLLNPIEFVRDGAELLDYLRAEGDYAFRNVSDLPDLILLDLNMPKIDGRKALSLIKQDPRFMHIPVVALTTSDTDADVLDVYNRGVNSYVVKPVTFTQLVTVMKNIGDYWFEIVKLPPAA